LGLGVVVTLALGFVGQGIEAVRGPKTTPPLRAPLSELGEGLDEPKGWGKLRRGNNVGNLRSLFWPTVVSAFAVAALGVCTHIMWEYYRRVPHLPDEASYLYQAKLFATGHVVRAIPTPKEAFYFWSPNFLYEHGDKWSSIYPFGHPLTLAIGTVFDLAWLVTPVCGAISVVLMYLVGKRLYDARTGAVSAVLLAASPFFLIQSANYMSHTPWLMYTLASLYFLSYLGKDTVNLARGPDGGVSYNRTRPVVFGTLSGLALGMALNTRPTETAMLLPAIGMVLLWNLVPKSGRKRAAFYVAGFCLGMGIMLALSLAYNAATTGDPLTSAYLDWDYPGATLGFNHGHTFDMGIRNEQTLLMATVLLLNVWPAWIGLGFVALPFLLGTRNRWDYFCLGCIVLVTSIYTLYRWSGIYEGPRYWYQAIPFFMLLTARGAERAAIVMASLALWLRTKLRRPPRYELAGALMAVYGVMLALIIWGSGGWLFGWNHTWAEPDSPQVPNELKYVRDLYRFDDRLIELRKRQHLTNALILVKVCGIWESWGCYAAVFPRNDVGLDGDVVWALYRTDHNEEVIKAFPGRDVYIADFDTNSIAYYNPEKDK
jgi:hypothetical protein